MQPGKLRVIPMLEQAYRHALAALHAALCSQRERELPLRESGRVLSTGDGIARVAGLPGVQLGELVQLPGGFGMVLDLTATAAGVVLLDRVTSLGTGDYVFRTGEVARVPVGEALLGRVIDPLGRPLDGGRAPSTQHYYPVERPPRPISDRAPVERPLQTGIKVIDALVAIGRGQRQLILGDRQVGKTSIALDTMVNQREQGVICIYLAVGQRQAATAQVIAALRQHQAMEYTIVMVASGSDPVGLQYLAPYAATSVGEYFMEHGHDVLVVYDDLTKHANTYRELSLLLRRPPGREAYPGDIFYVHSRLLERATHLREDLGGGSLTALPIVETQAQNISAYIPTNLISITDGQIYLDPGLYQQGFLPAVDVGLSVSRVGGKAQLPAYQGVVGPLKLTYSQYRELEMFSRISARLDDASQQAIDRGRRLREVFKQDLLEPVPPLGQLAALMALTEGKLDPIPLPDIPGAERAIRAKVESEGTALKKVVEARQPLRDHHRAHLEQLIEAALAGFQQRDEA
ncbi:MAG: F0F1 ATP synthase subunit alpha [Bacillota bacterium]